MLCFEGVVNRERLIVYTRIWCLKPYLRRPLDSSNSQLAAEIITRAALNRRQLHLLILLRHQAVPSARSFRGWLFLDPNFVGLISIIRYKDQSFSRLKSARKHPPNSSPLISDDMTCHRLKTFMSILLQTQRFSALSSEPMKILLVGKTFCRAPRIKTTL